MDDKPTASKSTEKGHHRILVVDDEASIRRMLNRLLTSVGYEVTEADSGRRALKLVSEEAFDTVLLDLRMPEVDGWETLISLRETWSSTQLPIIMVTAEPDSSKTAKALECGANDFLKKPFNINEILARISNQIAMKEAFTKATSQHQRMTTRGTFSSASEATLSLPQNHCASCLTLLWEDLENCSECGRGRPDQGWPSLGTESAPMLGSLIGDRYVLEHLIGKGATSHVYRARDIDLNRLFTAKIIDLSRAKHISRGHLRSEIESLAKVHSPHVVRIYEVFQIDEDHTALVMDYAPGRTLSQLVKQGCSPHRLLKIFRQVAQGLAQVHELNVVHRDVKPDNIMVDTFHTGEDFVMLLDFGIAQTKSTLNTSISFYGTPFYSAPEQFKAGSLVDARADIYALGVSLYEAIAGVTPFSADTVHGLIELHQNQPVPLLPEMCGTTPQRRALDELLETLMEKDINARPSDMGEVIDLIDITSLRIESKTP